MRWEPWLLAAYLSLILILKISGKDADWPSWDRMLIGSGRRPDWQPISNHCLINGGVSSSSKEGKALPRGRGKGWAKTTLDASLTTIDMLWVFVLSPMKWENVLSSSLRSSSPVFYSLLFWFWFCFLLLNPVLVLQVLLEKDMTVGSLSQGSLHGGEFWAELERLRTRSIWREEEGEMFQGEGLAGRSMLGIGVEPFVC